MSAENPVELFRSVLSVDLHARDLSLTGEQVDRLCAYYAMLSETNREMNLIGQDDPVLVAQRHFLDSLAPPALSLLQAGMKAIDVGTGAGFPGLALAIVRPDIRFTLLDSLRKRVAFLQRVVDALGLANVTCVAERAEDAARTSLRGQFDVALSRAVAALPVLLEYTLPFVRVGGSALCWKGPTAKEEIASARHALTVLGGGECQVLSYSPDGTREYAIVRVKHIRPCSTQYPRKVGIPTKTPL